MNKKGDIPITILVIGIFLVCTLAIVSFIYEKSKLENNFSRVSVVEDVSSLAEKYYSYKAFGVSGDDAINLVNARTKDGKILIVKEIEVSSFFNNKKTLGIKVESLFSP